MTEEGGREPVAESRIAVGIEKVSECFGWHNKATEQIRSGRWEGRMIDDG
jgi:hypothetical protein